MGWRQKRSLLGDVVDDDDLAAAARISLQMVVSTCSSPPGIEAEVDFVAHGAGDPAILGDPRHRGEAHAGRAADHLQNLWDRLDSGDGGQIVSKVVQKAALPALTLFD